MLKRLLSSFLASLFLMACGSTVGSQALPQAVIPLPEDDGGIVIGAPRDDGMVLVEADADIIPIGDVVIVEVMESNSESAFLTTDTLMSFRESCDPASIPECPTLSESGECQYTDAPELGFSFYVPASVEKTLRISYMNWEACEGGHLGDAPVTNDGNQIDRGGIIMPNPKDSIETNSGDTSGQDSTGTATTDDHATDGTMETTDSGPQLEPAKEPDLKGRALSDVAIGSIIFQNTLPNGAMVAVVMPPLWSPKQHPFAVIAISDRYSGTRIIQNYAFLPFEGGTYRTRLRLATSYAPTLLDVKDLTTGEFITLTVPELLPWPMLTTAK